MNPSRTLRPLLAAVAACAAFAISAAPSPAATAAATFKPYEFKPGQGPAVAAEWGEFQVPENRSNPKSRTLTLAFVRFKSTNPRPGAPIVYLAGGPGGSGIAAARGPRFSVFMELRKVADVIAFDQRGVSASSPIKGCTAPPLDLALPATEAVVVEFYGKAVAQCWDGWKAQGIDIAAYNTLENAADLDDLRRALGAPKINLWGISYGTHLAFATVKRYPNRIDRIALASAEGLDQTVKLPARADLAIGRIGGAIAANPAGQRMMPDLLSTMRRVHARLDRETPAVSFTPPGGQRVEFRFGAFPLQIMAGEMIKNPSGAASLAQVYAAADAGQYAPLAGPVYQILYAPRVIDGMGTAMDFASGVSPARMALVSEQAPKSAIGDTMNFPMPQLRTLIPGIELPASFRNGPRTNRPTLLLSGTLDGRTPVEEQTEAVAGFSKLTHVIVENGGHDLFEADPSIGVLIRRFFAGETLSERIVTLAPPRF